VVALSRENICDIRLKSILFPHIVAYRHPMGILSHFMNLRAVYIHLGWFQISITNLLVIIGMVALFVLALVLPFPGLKKEKDQK
jgi:hypothetical protein